RKYNGYSFPFEEIAKELYRIIKEGGVLVWVVGDSTINGTESLTSFKQAIYFTEQCGFNLHDTMIYHKETLPLSHNRYEQWFEYMFVFSKGKPKTFNGLRQKSNHFGITKNGPVNCASIGEAGSKMGGKKGKKIKIQEHKLRGNIWKYNVGAGQTTSDMIAFQHSAIFPDALAKEHIYTWSNESELIYDCFSGSGTMAKMAHLQKRNWIASEISKEYCELSEKRLAPYLAQTQLF
ncbi:MAG: site-specific DNA-methyltransferase, partial [Nanoarchaeota archaeon]